MPKIWRIVLEGIDKSGKSTLFDYFNELTAYKYCVQHRGLISLIAYDNLHRRQQVKYDNKIDIDGTLYVLLTCDRDDWRIRCKISNEPDIEFTAHTEAFEYVANKLLDLNAIRLCKLNTSNMSQKECVNNILFEIDKLNSIVSASNTVRLYCKSHRLAASISNMIKCISQFKVQVAINDFDNHIVTPYRYEICVDTTHSNIIDQSTFKTSKITNMIQSHNTQYKNLVRHLFNASIESGYSIALKILGDIQQ